MANSAALLALGSLALIPLYFMIRKASLNGGYTEWSEWDRCSASCAEGKHSRRRTCTRPPPGVFGETCLDQSLGPEKEEARCNIKACPIDGGFTFWSQFHECDKTCGNGVQKRTRSCSNPPPQYDGKKCEGPVEETKACNMRPCAVNGGLSAWGPFGECDKACGTGSRKRTRTCTNPPPSNGGKTCDPRALEEQEKCNIQPCPVDGGFTEWTNFEDCDKTCGSGVQRRKRTCTNPSPANGGKQCQGLSEETRKCNSNPCLTTQP